MKSRWINDQTVREKTHWSIFRVFNGFHSFFESTSKPRKVCSIDDHDDHWITVDRVWHCPKKQWGKYPEDLQCVYSERIELRNTMINDWRRFHWRKKRHQMENPNDAAIRIENVLIDRSNERRWRKENEEKPFVRTEPRNTIRFSPPQCCCITMISSPSGSIHSRSYSTLLLAPRYWIVIKQRCSGRSFCNETEWFQREQCRSIGFLPEDWPPNEDE